MFNKNLKYYQFKEKHVKKELASLIGVTPMAITYYESGERKPNRIRSRQWQKHLE